MRVIADTHVHLYPCHDSDVLFCRLLQNLARWDDSAIRAVFLTEAPGCHAFRDLCDGRLLPPGEGMEFVPGGEGEVAVMSREGHPRMYVFSGRQIVTQERLEILALTLDDAPRGGRPVQETVAAVLEAGGIPVLSWAPGKWFFKRGRIVRQLLGQFKPGELLIGDTSLRPTVWAEPLLMRRARKMGFGILAGSDTLPVPGDETYAGSYVSETDEPFDEKAPLESMREAFRRPGLKTVRFGKRCGPRQVLTRLKQHAAGK